VETPASGLASSIFAFHTRIEKVVKIPKRDELVGFLEHLMLRMSLSSEVCLMAFIFTWRLIRVARLQLLPFNWRPVLYAAVLIAAKYWEDF